MEDLQQHKFTIQGRLPNLNDYIDATRSHKMASAKMKEEAQLQVMWQIRAQLGPRVIDRPVFIQFSWYEPDRRRDRDNVASFGRKIIQDALVALGTLHDDGWDYVVGYYDEFAVDADNPRIEVVLIERPGTVKPRKREKRWRY